MSKQAKRFGVQLNGTCSRVESNDDQTGPVAGAGHADSPSLPVRPTAAGQRNRLHRAAAACHSVQLAPHISYPTEHPLKPHEHTTRH